MKQTNQIQKILSAMLCLVLIAAMALTITACKKTDAGNTSNGASQVAKSEAEELGDGKIQFNFTVTHKDGSKKAFSIKTDEATVGAALLKEKLIAGDAGQYGLYVKTVDGETLDYDQDKSYWAFIIDGNYAQSGVDQTKAVAGGNYMLKAEK